VPVSRSLQGMTASTRRGLEPPVENGSKTTCRLNLLDTGLISSRLSITGFDQVASSPILASSGPFSRASTVRAIIAMLAGSGTKASSIEASNTPPLRSISLAP